MKDRPANERPPNGASLSHEPSASRGLVRARIVVDQLREGAKSNGNILALCLDELSSSKIFLPVDRWNTSLSRAINEFSCDRLMPRCRSCAQAIRLFGNWPGAGDLII